MVDQLLKQRMIAGMREYVANENPLLPHQIDAIHDNADFLDRPIDAESKTGKKFEGGSNRMATGTGKTWVELCTAIAAGERAVIISPLTKINTQIADTYKLAHKLGLNPDDIAVYDDRRPAAEKRRAKEAKILVTTDDSFRTLHEKGIVSGDPENDAYRPLVLLDESDLMIGPNSSELLKQHYIPNCVTLGFSATDRGVSETLFGNQPRIHDLPTTDSISRGLLCYGVNTAALEVEAKDLSAQERAQLATKHVSEELNDKFAKDKAVVDSVVHFHGTYDDKDDLKNKKIGIGPIRRFPTLVKVPSIDAANRYAETFNNVFGEDYAVAVSGDTPHEDQLDPNTGIVVERGLNSLIRDFNAGLKPRVITFPQVLGRGTDIANATVILSVSDHIQIDPLTQNLGRVVRPGEEEYCERYGNDKIALGVNIFSKGARPALFSQVIDGPTIYSQKKPRKKNELPTIEPIPEKLQEGSAADMAVHASTTTITDVKKLNQLYQDAELARMEREGIVPPGWVSYEEALEIIGITPDQMQTRLRTIHAGERYTIFGTKLAPENREQVGNNYPPEALVMNRRGQRLLNAEMVDLWAKWQQRVEERHGPGAGTAQDIAREQGVRVSDVKKLKTFRPTLNMRAIEELGGPLPRPKGTSRG